MPYRQAAPLRDRIEVGFIEADVEIGFSLVDLADEQSKCGNSASVARILHDADDVLDDIGRRLSRLAVADQASFGPLVAELRRELALLRDTRCL